MKFSTIGGVILLGGKSARMGADKYLLPFSNSTVGQCLVDELNIVCEDVRCTAKFPEFIRMNNVPVHGDKYSTDSALAGIHAGLTYSTTPWSFIVACDLPFFDHRVVEIMASRIHSDIDAVVPIKNGYWEPLCALYSKQCLPTVTEMLEEGRFEIKKLFSKIRLASLDALDIEEHIHPHVFFNMNTPDDYRTAVELQKTLSGK